MNEWPADWEERKRGKNCAMCAQGRVDDNGFGLRIFAGTVSDAYLQRADVGQRGYTIIEWRGPHVAEPTELSDEDAAAFFHEVLRVARALERHFSPIKMNIEILGNSLPHLHAHLVPRYRDDGSPGRPARFMKADPDPARLGEDELVSDALALRAIV